MATTSTEEVLRALGVRVTKVGPEITAFCPVHLQTKGREEQHPSWRMNAVTGAWICHGCHAAGSLPMLVEVLGGDVESINTLVLTGAHEEIVRAVSEEIEEEEEERPYVSAYAYSKNPYPPRRMLESRDLDLETCQQMNIRWDKEAKCWLLPIYSFEGVLLGWQYKATGYFENYPKRVPKKVSLFGYQTVTGQNPVIVVESPLDAARFRCYGYEAVAIYGSFISDAQIKAIARASLGGRGTVILAYDKDEGGLSAAYGSTRRFLDAGLFVRYFAYPEQLLDCDPGDLRAADLHLGVRRASTMMPGEILAAAPLPRKTPYAS